MQGLAWRARWRKRPAPAAAPPRDDVDPFELLQEMERTAEQEWLRMAHRIEQVEAISDSIADRVRILATHELDQLYAIEEQIRRAPQYDHLLPEIDTLRGEVLAALDLVGSRLQEPPA